MIADQYALNHSYRNLANQIAAIISRTYVELGDGAEFADDEALLLIRDVLLAFDDTIMHRNRFNHVTKRLKSGYDFGRRK